MARQTQLVSEFIELAPPNLKDGVLYVSMVYASAIHKCCCGCGEKVVTPLSPTDWQLSFDGEAVSLYPSVGNWSFRCQSHYWIRGNKVYWAAQMSREQIDAGRAADRLARARYYDAARSDPEPAPHEISRGSFWSTIRRLLRLD